MTKLDPEKGRAVHVVRARGGNLKFRAIRLEAGNFAWGSEQFTAKTRIMDVTYNASNNELERTKTLVKGCVVQIDAAPFRTWFEKKYGVNLHKASAAKPAHKDEGKKSKHVQRDMKSLQKDLSLADSLKDQFMGGRLYAIVSSRPGQVGRADGYILEGKELEFYQKKIASKKSK